jgi:TIGR03009 family protein
MRRRSKIHLAHVLASWAAIAGATRVMGQEAEQPAAAAADDARQPAQAAGNAAAANPGDPAKMDQILRDWEKQSKRLKTLDVTIFRRDDTPAWGDVEFYKGRALFKSPNLAFIDFSKIKVDDQNRPVKDAAGEWVAVPNERIVCTGTEVWQYKNDTKQIFIFPLQKDAQQKAIEEGPLPFLFNMRADDARRRYKMTFLKDDAKANAHIVRIEPRLKEDMESFSVAFVNLDINYMLPTRIVMISPDGKSTKDFSLGPMYPNKQLVERNFEGKPMGSPWKIIRNPMGDERERTTNAQPRRPAPAGRPAAARRATDGTQR